MRRLTIELCLFLLIAPLMGAEVYKWVDESGRIYYSDKPPPGKTAKKVELPTAPSQDQPAVGGKTLEQQEAEFQHRQKQREATARREEAEREAARKAGTDLKKQCAEAKARLAYLQRQRRGPAPTRNEKGEIEWWNFEQRGIEINKLGEFVDRNCPPD